ncbi:uncharacterized protein [Gossypium hirsutum]|uniref:Uncharacterized protein isoform X2 n=1 Tax=Gossypium hirsutum TaxID=3635 RepID=A0ABM3B525_GOSHI|nr:uncharacterized protein LOC121223782 isoform X2 [Gossypium hirsutum]
MTGNDEGKDDKGTRIQGQRKRKQPDAVSNIATLNSLTKKRQHPTSFLPLPSVTNRPSFKTACTICKKEMEYPMICINAEVLCPFCNRYFLASVPQISQPRFFPPLSSTNSPVFTDYDQYKLVLRDPRYFRIMLELVSIIKSKLFQVPTFQGKELNLHRIFVEVSHRGGIHKVIRERRLQEVCAALAANLSVGLVYQMYMKWLYDLESWFFDSPPSEYLQTSSSSIAGAHLKQGVTGTKPSEQGHTSFADHSFGSLPTPYPKQGLIGGQPSGQGYSSFADLNSALVNDQIILVDDDDTQDFAPADEHGLSLSSDWDPSEWEVHPAVPDVCSPGIDPCHMKGALSTSNITSIRAEQQPSNDRNR